MWDLGIEPTFARQARYHFRDCSFLSPSFCSTPAIASWVSGSEFPPGVAGLHSCTVTAVSFVFGWHCCLWGSSLASSSLPGTLSRESPFLRLFLCSWAFLGASVSLSKCGQWVAQGPRELHPCVKDPAGACILPFSLSSCGLFMAVRDSRYGGWEELGKHAHSVFLIEISSLL